MYLPKFWSLTKEKLTKYLKFDTPISGIRLHRPSNLLAAICDDLCIRIVDIESKKVVRALWGHTNRIADLVGPILDSSNQDFF